MEKVIVTARIDGQTEEELRNVAKREDRSVSYLVRKAVERYVANVPRPARCNVKED